MRPEEAIRIIRNNLGKSIAPYSDEMEAFGMAIEALETSKNNYFDIYCTGYDDGILDYFDNIIRLSENGSKPITVDLIRDILQKMMKEANHGKD